MKTTNEIFDWLVRNCTYCVVPKSHEDVDRLVAEREKDGGITLLCAVNYIPGFHAKFNDFVAFLGEEYLFRQHLLPLIEAGLISCGGYATDATYERIFDSTSGLVKDYQTNESFVRFWLGEDDPNDKW